MDNIDNSKIELEYMLKNFLDDDKKLILFPAKRKMKLFALAYLAEKLEYDRTYTESEINDVLDAWSCFHDPATLRRELYDYHFVNREKNGRSYWRENPEKSTSGDE